jgi:glutathione S-transferase
MPYATAIVTCLALLLYGALIAQVSRARIKYSIHAPATSGHPAFERALRIQVNTGEQLLLFLPGLWMFATLVSSACAALLGLAWIAGRILYAMSYAADPARRAPGFTIAGLATGVLLLGSLIAGLIGLL